MDWELYERYRATLLLVGVALVSFLLLVFQKTSPVRILRSFLVVTTLPTERFLSGWKNDVQAPNAPTLEVTPTDVAVSTDTVTAPPVEAIALVPSEDRRARQVLTDENHRLRDLLQLKENRWPQGLAAHVVGRDPQRWFQEIVLDKGHDDGVSVDDPIVALVGGQEGLVGRVIETNPHVSKVMLIQDSLSAVAATVRSLKEEDGVVEGSNAHALFLKYLDRGSSVKLGDLVTTSGLGGAFPESIPIGWVEDVSLDPRQLFLQARLRPVMGSATVHVVLILRKPA